MALGVMKAENFQPLDECSLNEPFKSTLTFALTNGDIFVIEMEAKSCMIIQMTRMNGII